MWRHGICYTDLETGEPVKGAVEAKIKIMVNSKSINDKFEDCHLLFIGSDSLSHLAKILKKVENKPTLTVSNHGTFARYGVMINIREIKNNKVRYAVNNMTARKSKLKISEDLLKKAIETYG